MRKIPIHQTIILTEGAVVRQVLAQITVPDIVPREPSLSIIGTPPIAGEVGQPYSFQPSTANEWGTKLFSLASGTLLEGLSLDTSTGAITGTPTVAGTMKALSVRVTDEIGSASTTPTTVKIAPPAPPPTDVSSFSLVILRAGSWRALPLPLLEA